MTHQQTPLGNLSFVGLIHVALLAAVVAVSQLTASDTELRLGPNEIVWGTEILNEYVDQGALRHDDVPARGYFRGRYANIGLELDAIVGLGEDQRTDIEPFEIVELNGRIDYLITLPDVAQIFPYLETETFPNWSRPHDAVWLGVNGWYLLPYEGIEIGGNIAMT